MGVRRLMWLARSILDVSARLMAAGWLVQTMLPTLCCCCLSVGTTAAYASDQTLQLPASCCCHTLLKHRGYLLQSKSDVVAECPGTSCPTCDSCDCIRASDNQQSTLRRRLLEDSKQSISSFVLPCLDILPDDNSHRRLFTQANACDSEDLLSGVERCVSLQRFLL